MAKIIANLFNRSLKQKLIFLFIALAAVPLVLTTMATSFLSHSALADSVFVNNSLRASFLAREVDVNLTTKVKALQILANSAEVQSMNPEQQLPALQRLFKQYPDMVPVVTDVQGMQTVRPDSISKVNSGDREYFKQVKNGAEMAISDVLMSKTNDRAVVAIAIPIKDARNIFRGSVLGVVDLNAISEDIAKNKIGKTGFVFLVDRQGKVVAHPDHSMVMQMTDLSGLAPVKMAISGQTGVTEYETQGARKLAGYSNIPLAGWGIIAQQDMDEAVAGATKVRLAGIGFTLVAIVLAIAVGLLAASVLTKPLLELVAVATKLSEGDLTAKAKVTSKDELGQLANTFNSMIDHLRELIRAVANTADQVAASSQQLSATSNEAEQAINQIATTMTESADGAYQQTEEVKKTLLIAANLTEVSQSAAAKAQEASALSAEMTTAAETGDSAASNAVSKINEIKEVTAATGQVVNVLDEKSKAISRIIDVISGIAGQTNLLALNAAIEAARAGEQGRGFAVVAEEVRKLAEQSQEATKRITQIIREIEEQIADAVMAIDSGRVKVDEGVDVVESAGRALQNILSQITNSIKMIQDINAASSQQLEGMQDMTRSTEQVSVIASRASASAQTAAASSEEVTASMEDIASAAQSLAIMASELQMLVARFKV
ncbi:MAG: methyl-accepting chemotaxis protein [Negativicutes bacterium]|nr:methyl-accepting chemotaxis protein [Negativicutes bacterium]